MPREFMTVPRRRNSASRNLATLLVLAVFLLSLPAQAQQLVAIPPGKEDAVLKLFQPLKLGDELPGEHVWTNLSIEPQSLVAKLVPKAEGQQDVLVSFVVELDGLKAVGTQVLLEPDEASLSEGAQQAVEAIRAPVAKNLSPRAWNALLNPTPSAEAQAGGEGAGSANLFMVAGAGAVLIGLFLGFVVLRRKPAQQESVEAQGQEGEGGVQPEV